jgi:[acyl-carrier-protein] S-malonyltransferase
MGKGLYDNFPVARQVFEEIDKQAGRQLSQLCFEGPEQELKRTINTQPTVLAVSLAAWRCYLALNGPLPDFVAGHSLGEFTALVAAGVLTQSDAVKLVGKRAQLMEDCPVGAMSAVIGLDAATLGEICKEASGESGKIVIVANINTREQLVISGSPEAVVNAGGKAKVAGGKVIPLPVGGAFHSPLMEKAASEFEQELKNCTFADARIKVVQNFDAAAADSADEISRKLRMQMPSAVRWCESIECMLSAGVSNFIEIGPGKALAGMVKKIDRSARVFNIFDDESLKSTLSELAGTVIAK